MFTPAPGRPNSCLCTWHAVCSAHYENLPPDWTYSCTHHNRSVSTVAASIRYLLRARGVLHLFLVRSWPGQLALAIPLYLHLPPGRAGVGLTPTTASLRAQTREGLGVAGQQWIDTPHRPLCCCRRCLHQPPLLQPRQDLPSPLQHIGRLVQAPSPPLTQRPTASGTTSRTQVPCAPTYHLPGATTASEPTARQSRTPWHPVEFAGNT